jgi:hypothetical protein
LPGGGSGAAVSKRRKVIPLLATLAAPGLLYLVARTAAVGLSPGYSAVLPPTSVASLLRPLVFAATQPTYRPSGDVRPLLERGATTAPLAFEPFYLEAKTAESAGQLDRAIALMEEARRRYSSFVLTRVQLLAYYGKARRYTSMISEMNLVLGVSPEVRTAMLPELAKLISDPDGRLALAAVLADSPPWSQDFFQAASNANFTSQDAAALLSQLRQRGAGGEELRLAQSLYLRSLVSTGEYGRARAIWLEALPDAERQRSGLMFDGGFSGTEAPAPFGWTLHDQEAGRAEIAQSQEAGHHLDVHYFGGLDAVLAEQTLALPPGGYRLRFQARTNSEIRSGNIAWVVTCLPSGAEAVRIPIEPSRDEFQPIAATFSVPGSGCAGQRLLLVATVGDVSQVINVQLGRMELGREN